MSHESPEVVSARCEQARAVRAVNRSGGQPEMQQKAEQANQNYRTVKAADFLRNTVDRWPPLTQEQRSKLAQILRAPA